MRVVHWVLIACMVLAVGCSSDDPDLTPSGSEGSEISQASETPSAEATETPAPTQPPTETPTEQPTTPAEPARELFTSLPRGYRYVNLPTETREQLSDLMGGIEQDPIIHDVATKYVKKRSSSIAAVMAIRFTAESTTSDRRRFAQGITGDDAKRARIARKDVLFIDGRKWAFYMGDDFALVFARASRTGLERVVRAMVTDAPAQ